MRGRLPPPSGVFRGAELLLSPTSTMGYVVAALAAAHGTPRVTMLHDCEPPPTLEGAFHLLPKAMKRSGMCVVRKADLEGVGGVCHHEHGETTCSTAGAASVTRSTRLLWNRTKLRW